MEFAESFQRPLPIEKKFVIIVSTLYGCPVKCQMCDAGTTHHGKLTKEEIFEQIDYIVDKRFLSRNIGCEKFKIQFARIGEPAFNNAVLDVLKELPERYKTQGLMPCISTIAPAGCDEFFDGLLCIKNELFNKGNFQLQFSIHTTNQRIRDEIIPFKKWSFNDISAYGEKFFKLGDRKITLNFAAIKGNPLDPKVIRGIFNPDKFILKFTPVNPTKSVKRLNLKSFIDVKQPNMDNLFRELNSYGFKAILSIGDLDENAVGSNCGQVLNSVRIDDNG